jgi:hypothetical protein
VIIEGGGDAEDAFDILLVVDCVPALPDQFEVVMRRET